MKKLLLIIAIVMIAAKSQAQISIDWSVSEIVSPTQINSSATGTNVPYDVVLKNLGNDSAIAGDSVFFSFYVAIGSTAYLYYPSANLNVVGFAKKLTRTVKTSDTIHLVGAVKFNTNISPSANASLVFTSIILNRSRGLGYEGSGTAPNNVKLASIVWYNIQGWAVNVVNTNLDEVKIFPTIANTVLNLNLQVMDIKNNVNVKIYDMMGRMVQQNEFETGLTNYAIPTDALINGNYIIKIENGQYNASKKFIVNK